MLYRELLQVAPFQSCWQNSVQAKCHSSWPVKSTEAPKQITTNLQFHTDAFV